ncbi:MAG: mechanosensitive ion channel [Chitinophagales bacterium]|nr:mechanosensitive ion channel [Chitinophagales bacterium]
MIIHSILLNSNNLSPWEKVSNKLVGWYDALVINLPNILIALLLFTISFFLSKFLQEKISRLLRRFIKQPSIRELIGNLTAIVIIMLGLILALAVLNLDSTLKSLLAGAGVAGLAISLALQGALTNTFSGIFIAVNDELNIGDWIESNGFAGNIEEIDLRNTKIKEADNNIVVIPNKMILDKPFKNYGLTKRIRCSIECGIDYESDLEKTKNIAIAAIQQKFPNNDGSKVEFYYTNFGDSAIDFSQV